MVGRILMFMWLWGPLHLMVTGGQNLQGPKVPKYWVVGASMLGIVIGIMLLDRYILFGYLDSQGQVHTFICEFPKIRALRMDPKYQDPQYKDPRRGHPTSGSSHIAPSLMI